MGFSNIQWTESQCASSDGVLISHLIGQHLLDSCVTESDDDANSLDYHVGLLYNTLKLNPHKSTKD